MKHYLTIKKSVKKGLLKDVYHYPLFLNSNNEIKLRLQETLLNYNNRIKINLAYGFALRNRITDELRFFHPSNNNMLFNAPMMIDNEDDHSKLLEDTEREDALEYARLQRPSTNWIVETLVCVRFEIFKVIA